MYFLRDFVTKKPVTAADLVFTGDGVPWEVVMDLDQIRAKINIDYFRKAPPYASKYLPFMPIKNYSNFVSLEEGATPLIRSKRLGGRLGIDLWFKLEPQNPTGSFKDRGSAVDLTIARENSAKAIVLASTGNMAASCSCYAAAAQIPCFVFVPDGTPVSKLSQVIAFGGHVVQVKGNYNDAALLAERVARELNFYLAGDYAFRVEGQKTAAYEIIDQFFYQAPDVVVIPIGCGTNITAYGKGFNEYRELGFIDRLPRLIGVQAQGANSVVEAFEKGSREIVATKVVETIASAIAIAKPIDGIKALDAIYDSSGSALAVNDREMLEAQYLLSSEEGLFVESSCAAAIAAITKLATSLKGQRVVCVLTGDGLKDPSSILKIAIKPPIILPEVSDFLALYRGSYFAGHSVAFSDRSEVIFTEEPNLADLKHKLTKYFRTSYSERHVENMLAIISRFLKKGKPITFSDLQDIVQDALEILEQPTAQVLVVDDFKIVTSKDNKPNAQVSITITEHGQTKSRQAESNGVGPVDAVINALKLACGESVSFSLVGYKVGIRSEGTDAVTNVELRLNKNGVISVGTGTSPDIIQASIEAFEEAYNRSFSK